MKFTKAEQNRLNKLTAGLKKNTRLDSGASIKAYQDKYAPNGKIFKGKWRRWDNRTRTWYDPKVVKAYLNKQEYGTTTPKQDLKYLQAKKLQIERETGVQYNDPLREEFSRKLVIDDKNQYGSMYEKEQDARRQKDRANLIKLRKNTSFYRLDQAYQAGELEREEYEWGPGGQPGSSLKINKPLNEEQKDIQRTNTKLLNIPPPNVDNVDKKTIPIENSTDPLEPTAAILQADLRALNRLNIQGIKGLKGTNITLAIMRKEQELSKLKGDTYPSLTGRDHHGVGYSTNTEARDWLRINKL